MIKHSVLNHHFNLNFFCQFTEEDIILVPRYVEGRTRNLFSRPSVRILSRSLQDLVTRNMIVRPVKKDVLEHVTRLLKFFNHHKLIKKLF